VSRGRGRTRRELAELAAAGLLAGRGVVAAGGSLRPGVVGTATLGAQGLDRAAARRALELALGRALGAERAVAGLASLFSASDTVGIKLNCLAGPRMSPRIELVEALVDLLAEAGVARSKILVFERSSRELERAGFAIRRSDGPYLCHGTDNQWDREPSTSGSIGSCFAREVSTTCSALISFGVVKDHDLSGVSAGIKNWYGVIHNPNKYHGSNCDPYLADVLRHPFIAGKLRLTVLDGVEGQCQGGPAFYPGGIFPLGTVAASADPVAADLWAWQVLDAERARRGLPSLASDRRAPSFIATAARYGLGVGDPAQLRVVAG
jgi:uncharacterized protein (DUF362 family)